MPCEKMKLVRRDTIDEDFEVCPDSPIPELCQGGVRVKVEYAGACYTDTQVVKSGFKRPKMPGIRDTSLFPGFEVSGEVERVCTVAGNPPLHVKVGDKVLVYPEDEDMGSTGYAEYVCVPNPANLIKVPSDLPLELAALLPCGALKAFSAATRAKALMEGTSIATKDKVNLLIVGAGGLGLWTLAMAKYIFSNYCGRIRFTIADPCTEKLMIAKDQGCTEVIHWCEDAHEEYIIQRTKNVCPDGVDVIIDFVSSHRTIKRAITVLAEEGVLIVGGNSKYDVTFNMEDLARKRQTITGVGRGSREQLQELVQLITEKKISIPPYKVFPVGEANEVFKQLGQCHLIGRAVLKVSDMATGLEKEI